MGETLLGIEVIWDIQLIKSILQEGLPAMGANQDTDVPIGLATIGLPLDILRDTHSNQSSTLHRLFRVITRIGNSLIILRQVNEDWQLVFPLTSNTNAHSILLTIGVLELVNIHSL